MWDYVVHKQYRQGQRAALSPSPSAASGDGKASLATSVPPCQAGDAGSATFASVRKRWICKGFVAAGSRVSVILSVKRWLV